MAFWSCLELDEGRSVSTPYTDQSLDTGCPGKGHALRQGASLQPRAIPGEG